MSVRKHNLAPECQQFATQQIIARCENGPLSKRDATALSKYRDQQVLTLRHIREDTLEFLSTWSDLRSLRMYGCSIPDCNALRRLKKLSHLWYNTNRSRTPDLSFMSSLTGLEELGIGYVAYLTALPDLSQCRRLKRLSIFSCKRLSDIDTVTKLPKLRSFSIACTPHGPQDLEAIMAIPTLQKISGAFGSAAQDKVFHEMIEQYELQYG